MKTILIRENQMHLFEEIEGNMVPTKQWMQTKYNQFNKELFDGFLPPCRLMAKKLAPKHLGMYSTNSVYPNGPVTRENIYDIARPTIYLTTAYSAPEEDWDNTLIHEMCHYYTQFDKEGNARKIDKENKGHGANFMNAAKLVSDKSGGKYTIQHIATAEQSSRMGFETKDRSFSEMKGIRLIRVSFANNGVSTEAFIMTNSEFVAKQILDMSADKRILVTDNSSLIKILMNAGYKIYSPIIAKNAIYTMNPTIKDLFDKCRFIEFREGDF
jgi:hypothetical protein